MAVNKTFNNGYITIIAAILAVVAGFVFPSKASLLKPLGNLFLTLISISIIPIVFSSITGSIIKILTFKKTEIKLSSIVLTFLSALILSSIIGIVTGFVFDPAQILSDSDNLKDLIFQDIQNSIATIDLETNLDSISSFSVLDFISTLFPRNPFKAFSDGNVIQIIALSVLVGIAISSLKSEQRDYATKGLDILMESFKQILRIPTKILPFGMFFFLASNIATVKFQDLIAMKFFFLSVIAGFLIIASSSIILLKLYSPLSLTKTLKGFKDAIIVAFSTHSNQTTLPFLIEALSDNIHLPKHIVNFATPLGVTMCRTSNVMYYAFVAIFVASVYNEPLGTYQYSIIVLGAILTSFASTGTSGVIAITMISIILDPLNLPLESMFVILVAIDPVIEPIRTVTSLVANAALSCFIINKQRRRFQ